MAHGGVKFLRGAVGDYVQYFLGEAGRGCAQMGYYGEGRRWAVSASGVRQAGAWTPEEYARWLAGADPHTGEQRGSKVADGDLRSGVRGYEFSVNVPKSASILALLDPELGQALGAAQERAAQVGLEALRRRVRVRIEGEVIDGKRSQQLLEVDELEVAVFSHEGSRDGDPHQHLHVQVGAKTFVAGRWRALAGRQMLASLGEWNATVAAALATDPGWVRACARKGLTVTADGGVAQVPREVERALSRRTVAIDARREELIAEFTAENHRAPGARELVWIDQRAWANTRPRKGERDLLSIEATRDLVRQHGGEEILRALDSSTRGRVAKLDVPAAISAGVGIANERELLSESDLAAVAAQAIAASGGVAEDLTAAIESVRLGVRAACAAVDLPAGDTGWMPLGVLRAADTVHQHLSSMAAVATPQAAGLSTVDTRGLAPGQALAAEAVSAGVPCVIEGPAGTGKTTALRAALAARTRAGLLTCAVAKSAAAVAQLGEGWSQVATADAMLIKAGWTRTDGQWTPPTDGADSGSNSAHQPDLRGSVLVVDEAAMMDIHTLAALCQHATTIGQRVVLVGDDRQLSAVGAGGGFTVASMGLDVIALTEAQRFTDPRHADLAAAWRSSTDIDTVIDQIMDAGIITRHAHDDDARIAAAQAATDAGVIVMAPDNDTASAISRLARAERVAHGEVASSTRRLGKYEENIGVGDIVQTRRNDRELGVRNRDRWKVMALTHDEGLKLAPIDRNGAVRRDRAIELPPEYVSAHVHYADAVTVYAAQGATAREGVAIVDDTWTREQAYVALTRGRDATTWHVVAESDDAVRDVLRSVLAMSDRGRSELVAQVTRERLLTGRYDLAPAVAERLDTASDQPLAWRSGAVQDIASDVPTPTAPSMGD